MPRAETNGIEIEYETLGDPEDPALLLIRGLGSQLVSWEDDFLDGFIDRGFFVIRFDNRDVGLSTKIESGDLDIVGAIAKAMHGEEIEAPYAVRDMAADSVGVLDALNIERAHVAGMSLGGAIAQTMAIEHRDRLLSLTTIMSTTGDTDVGLPSGEALAGLVMPEPSDREGYIQHHVDTGRVIGSPEHFEEERVRAAAARCFDRCHHPRGVSHQLLAGMTAGSRSAALRELDINAVVIHGSVDPLVNVSGGERTAEVLQGSELVVLDGMGHDLPSYFWNSIIEAITNLASRSVEAA